MNANHLFSPARFVIALIGTAAFMSIVSCGEQSVSPQGSSADSSNTTAAKGPDVSALPIKGKLVSAVAPKKAAFGMIWFNTTENREYIFDGTQWVPHDQTVDDFYNSQALITKNTAKTVALTLDEVCVDGDPACTPTGAHAKHGSFACSVCHKVAGRLAFDKLGPAYATGYNPTFDATAKTCSNVACHGVPSGTFSYYFPGGDGEPVLNTVTYGGGTGSAQTTPSWYVTGAGTCAGCHGNPPRNGSSGTNVWHSGNHAGTPTSSTNQCQFCHPDATGTNGQGVSITNAALHANGTVNVQARFTSACFGCH